MSRLYSYLVFFYNLTAFFFSMFFWHIEMLALPSLYFQDVTFSYSNHICYVFWLRFSWCFGLSKKVRSVEQDCTYLSIHLPSSWVLHCEIVWLPYTTVYGPCTQCSVSSGLRSISTAHKLSKEKLSNGCFLGGYFVRGSNSSSYSEASSWGSLLIPNIHSLFHSFLWYLNWDVNLLKLWSTQFSGFGL